MKKIEKSVTSMYQFLARGELILIGIASLGYQQGVWIGMRT